jgi:uncharacterized membrane protein
MTNPEAPGSAWERLPDFEIVKKWQEAVPNAAARILTQVEEDAKFIRRDAERRLKYALLIVILTIIATVTLAILDKTVPAILSSSGGTITVAITLITGRSTSLVEKAKRSRTNSS